MIKFLFKTAVTLGIAGLALEGVKKIIEDRVAEDQVDDDLPFEEEYVTLTRTEPVPAEDHTGEPAEGVSEEKAEEAAQDVAAAITADMTAEQEETAEEIKEEAEQPAEEVTVEVTEEQSAPDDTTAD